ncbi:MAG: DUF1318 domain-containing protein [Candidatus Omnitrophota bacterium]
MRKTMIAILIIALLGCTKLRVETTKPIQLDINMRVDIYQHVIEDVESINDEIYGTKNKQLNSLFFINEVYAQELPAAAQEAVERRKLRFPALQKYFESGYLGENRNALVVLRANVPEDIKTGIVILINEENSDRYKIFAETAEKNEADIEEVQKIFFKDDFARTQQGFWFEIYDDSQGQYVWVQK